MAQRPFFRRRKSCPFSGANAPADRLQGREAPAALHLRARQDRALAHHRRLVEEAARARPRHQARRASSRSCPTPSAKEDAHASRSSRTRRQARPDGRGRRSVRTATPATSSCRRARRCAPPRPTSSASRPSAPSSRSATSSSKKEAEKVAAKLDGQTFVVIRSASDGGALYGSVTTRDIADAATAGGFSLDRRQVVLDQPIKELGLHPIAVVLHPEVEATITRQRRPQPARRPSCRPPARPSRSCRPRPRPPPSSTSRSSSTTSAAPPTRTARSRPAEPPYRQRKARPEPRARLSDSRSRVPGSGRRRARAAGTVGPAAARRQWWSFGAALPSGCRRRRASMFRPSTSAEKAIAA